MLYKIHHPKIDSNNLNAFLYTNHIGVYLTNTRNTLCSAEQKKKKKTTMATRRRTEKIHFHKQIYYRRIHKA